LEEETEVNKGLHFRLFGVVLIFLGALDCLLSWRGSLTVSYFYVVLLALGIFLFAVGHISGRHNRKS